MTEVAPRSARPGWLKVVGPVLAAVGGILTGALAGNAMGWAMTAGAALLFVLGTLGKRVVGILVVVVAILSGWAALAADPVQVAGAIGSALGLVGGALIVLTARWWARRRSRFERGGRAVSADAAPLEVWKAMDEGHDPTAVESEDR